MGNRVSSLRAWGKSVNTMAHSAQLISAIQCKRSWHDQMRNCLKRQATVHFAKKGQRHHNTAANAAFLYSSHVSSTHVHAQQPV